jgi:NAD(P)H dehydrogenase (quinone)
MTKVLVLYYSTYGHIELVSAEVAKNSHFKLDQPAPVAVVADLANYDAIVIGTGTRFGRMSSQMANFLDQAGGLWAKGALNGKVGAAFTSTATQHGGQETTLFSIITNLLHFGMVVVGMDYGYGSQMTLEEIVGGAPYGATTIAGGDGSRQPSQKELDGARYQGRRVAEVAAKLHG